MVRHHASPDLLAERSPVQARCLLHLGHYGQGLVSVGPGDAEHRAAPPAELIKKAGGGWVGSGGGGEEARSERGEGG